MARSKSPREHRSGRKAVVRIGSFEIYSTGAARFDLGDPYHLIATMSWPMFFLSLVLSQAAINLAFAALYAAVPGTIANAQPGSLADAFFFSIETLMTVGYGAMVPATRYGHIVSAVEIVFGMVYTAVVTGMIFVRFSKPKAKIVYAEHPVVSHHNGHPTLMLRIANGRAQLLTDATVRLYVLLPETGPEGQRFRRTHNLELSRSDFPLFALTWTLMHRIDATSPLHGFTREGLIEEHVRLFVSIRARDPALAAEVHDLKSYPADAIAWGMRYSDAVTLDDQGRALADLRRVSLIEPETRREAAMERAKP